MIRWQTLNGALRWGSGDGGSFLRQTASSFLICPPTAVLTASSLKKFVTKYKAAYIKPNGKHRGEGIIKVWKTSAGYAFVREQGEPLVFSSLVSLYRTIRKETPKTKYVIQKAIDLAEVEGRPHDFRIMMMRDTQRQWRYVGMLARVAHKDCVITNAKREHGKVINAETALKQSFEDADVEKLKQQMIQLSYQICRRLDHYQYYWKAGVDLAFDKKGKLWMIEANTWPGVTAFRKLPDQSTYRKIRAMAAAYRRRRRVKIPSKALP
ncbi:YheC/YheD family protein [Effusibacillus consociatus]|uniref:YheC/YheD family protein n=1 Tax=Effusibacillus consociatus TaxID=1117041 RepID=A0ABV9PX10_9BACL